MTINQLYHLHIGHPAIDGVCFATEKDSNELYLLLIQVSLRSYRYHASKGNDIKTQASWATSKVSIVEYYANLSIVGEDHVIYLYVSPYEVEDPQRSTFSLEVDQAVLKSGCRSKPYWYGFVRKPSDTYQLIKELDS